MKQTNSRETEKRGQYQWIQDLILLFLVSHFLYISVLYKCLYSLQHGLVNAEVCHKLCAGEKSEIQQNNKVACKTTSFHQSVNLLALILPLQVMTIMALSEKQDTPAFSMKIP